MTTESTASKEQEIDLLDLSLVFLKRKKFIFGGTLAFADRCDRRFPGCLSHV